MKIVASISRVLVGSLFIVSGLIKANDTLGFSYKLIEYFEPGVLNMEFLIPFAWELAAIISIVEIILGAAAIFGSKIKWVSWLLLGMIVFFTWLTFYSAYYNKVTDCGCFGDALKLTPWESFTKDVVLLFFVGIIFLFKNRIKPNSKADNQWMLPLSVGLIAWFSGGVLNWWFPLTFSIICFGVVLLLHSFTSKTDRLSIYVSTFLSLLFTGYTIYALPLRDFRPYAEGKSLIEGMKSAAELGLDGPVYATDYKLKNKQTGDVKTVGSNVYMEQQMWDAWDYVEAVGESYKVKDGYEPPIHDFSISDEEGNDKVPELLNAPNPVLLVIAYDINKSNKSSQAEINELYKAAILAGWEVYGVTASAKEDVLKFKRETDSYLDFLSADGIVLKTIIRSNPGLVLIHEGIVVAKYPWTQLPQFKELDKRL